MRKPRMRALIPELTGVGLAVVCIAAVGFASGSLGTLLHTHLNRKLTAALVMAVVAVLALAVLLGAVLVAHARQHRTVAAFLSEAVAKTESSWVRGAVYFVAYTLTAALCAFLWGVTG